MEVAVGWLYPTQTPIQNTGQASLLKESALSIHIVALLLSKAILGEIYISTSTSFLQMNLLQVGFKLA